jgi:GntR family transcriptional repressor for pyruvate dehydrogenase complex
MADKVTFDQIERLPRLSDTIADRLQEAILVGDFEPGDVLPSERSLGLQFGVSRTVIREAIRTLSVKGIVKVQSGRGVEVLPVSTAPVTQAMSLLLRGANEVGFDQIHEVRLMLEAHVAGVAAERATQEELDHLDEIYRRMDEVNRSPGPPTEVDLDVEFHRAIARAAHNDLFLVLLDSIAGVQMQARQKILVLFDSPYPFLDDHRTILESLNKRDPGAARAAMEECLSRVHAVWHEQFRDDR